MQQQKHNADGSAATLLLLDAPDVWLAQLLSGQYLDNDSELSLFQTCKKLNEMVMQNNSSTSLRIHPLARPSNRVLNMLQTANRHAPSIKLSLHYEFGRDTSWQVGQEAAKQMMQVVCSILQEAAKQGATTAIKELQLEGTNLETVLPPVIGQACPNLNKLSLCDCTIHSDRAISASQHFRELRALELHECQLNEAACGQQQACRMPSPGLAALSSITITLYTASEFDEEVNIIDSLAAPLTRLCFDTTGTDSGSVSVDYDLRGLDWAKLGATLQHLQLSGLQAGDEAMEMFLSMPCLKHVLIQEFELEKSFVGRSCKWEELVIEWYVSVKTLAYLPLHSGLVLKLGEEATGRACCLSMDTGTCHLLSQAVSNVQRAKALEWAAGCATLSQDKMEASKLAECLSQALPLIKDVKTLGIFSGDLNAAAMQTLCEFVRGREDEPSVSFGSDTQWLVEDMETFVLNMPRGGTIDVTIDGPDVEQQLVQLCCAAQHTLSLKAYSRDTAVAKGEEHLCEQRIRSALQARNIELVSLSCEPGIYTTAVNATVQPRHVRLSWIIKTPGWPTDLLQQA